MSGHLLDRWRLIAHAARMKARLSRGDVSVLLQICERFNMKAGAAWPSLETLARDAGLSRQAVIASIRRLQAAGLLTIRPGRGRASTRYEPNFEAARSSQEELTATDDDESASSQEELTATDDAAERSSQVQDPVAVKCTGRSSQAHLTRTYLEPGENQVLRERGAAAPDPAAAGPACAPAGVDAQAWSALVAARPDLNPTRLAEQATHHAQAGCPALAMRQAMDALRLTRAFSDLMPRYRRRPAANAKPRGKKRSAGLLDNFRSAEALALYDQPLE